MKLILKVKKEDLISNFLNADEDFKSDICNLYVQGSTMKDLAQKYFKTNQTYKIRKILLSNNMKIRTKSETKRLLDKRYNGKIGFNCRLYNIDKNYFKAWSANMAYILGFITSDGNVSKGSLNFGLNYKDIDILESIKEELKYTGKIYNRVSKIGKNVYPSVYLNIKCKTIYDDLISLGIVENKSLILEPLQKLPKKYFIDYLRGYFDGDGSVGIQYPKSKRAETKVAQIRVRICSGSEKIIQYFVDELHLLGIKKATFTSRKKNYHEVCYSTSDSLKLYKMMYYSKNVLCLKRKKELYDNYISIRDSDCKSSIGHIKI